MDNQSSTPYFKRVFRVFRFAWRISPAFVLLNIAYFLLKSFFPYVVIFCSARIIDAIVAGEGASSIMVIVYWMVGVDFVVGVLMNLTLQLANSCRSKADIKISRLLSEKTYSLSYAQIEDQKTMRLIEMAREGSNGSGGLGAFMNNIGTAISGLSNLIYSCVLLSGLFVSGLATRNDAWTPLLSNPWSALIIFGSVLLVVALAIPLASISQKASYNTMVKNVENNRQYEYFYETSVNYLYGKDIRLFRLDRLILGMQKEEKYSINKTWAGYVNFDTFFSILIAFFYGFLSFIAYGFLGLKALYGLISIGTAVSYAGAVTLMSDGFRTIIQGTIGAGLNANYLQNYFIYMSLPSKLRFGNEELDEKAPLSIDFDHVSFTYPNQSEKALDDVSLSIHSGEKLAIVGVNGAGKTTLMKLICRFYEPDSGTIYVNGKPLDSYNARSAYRLYSIVFQDYKLFSFPLKENVAASDQANEKSVIFCLTQAGIAEKVLSWPNGINTVLYNKNEKNGVEVSGGEAQKIAIARALYKDSPLVILDEPTSALDPKSEADIYERFGSLVKGKTAVFISHRMSSTKFCDDVIVVDAGKIAEEGRHDELIKKNGLYKKMWDAQAQYYQ
ncbi:MAG: ABC transporter ATP-binding protein/permease [Bacilli bacterium]|jgi:ATP-binding cassette subfamily B protein|nr:ABC transporter ATP-binding protein/permease [Bacilli bacterium]